MILDAVAGFDRLFLLPLARTLAELAERDGPPPASAEDGDMRTIEVRLDWGDRETVIGTLAEQGRRTYFEYAPSFLEAPLPVSPFRLPARAGVIEHVERDFAPVFGAFEDSLPDRWGTLLMDREFKRRG